MRVTWSLALLAAVILGLGCLVYADGTVRVFVNGIDLGPGGQGRMIEGQVMVPIRAIAEALGAEVSWAPDESSVYITTRTAPDAQEGPAAEHGASGEISVYVTKSGGKYHVLGCRHLSESSVPISLDDAKARGYEPCTVCEPPE